MARRQAIATSWARYGVPNCQRTRAPGETRTLVAALRVQYPRRWTTSAITSVGPEGLEPSPGGLRVRCAAASTLIPCSPFFTRREWARRESNPQSDPYKRPALTVELRAVKRRVGPKGFEPSPTGLKVRRAAVTPRPQNVGRAYSFQSCLVHAASPRIQW